MSDFVLIFPAFNPFWLCDWTPCSDKALSFYSIHLQGFLQQIHKFLIFNLSVSAGSVTYDKCSNQLGKEANTAMNYK